MTLHPSRRLLLLLSLSACFLLALRLAAGTDALRGVAARNAGFLAFNKIALALGNGSQPTDDQLARGVSQLTQATALAPRSDSALRALGYLYLAAGNEAAALAAWARTDTVAGELLDKGQAAEEAGNTAEAMVWYERATVVEPTGAEGWLRVGALHETAGDPAAALAVYQAGTRASPRNSDLLYRLGHLNSRLTAPVDWPAILLLTEQALALDNFLHDWDKVQTHLLRGDSLQNLGQDEAAQAEFIWVVEQHPNEYFAILRYGEMSWKLENDLAKAEEILRRAVALDAQNKWAYLSLARVYNEAGQRAQAQAMYERVLELDPGDRAANRWLNQP